MYIQRWLYSTNAKDIAMLYFIFAIFSGVIGSTMSLIIRLELAAPGNQILHGNHQLFNVLVVGHALLMIFFLVMPGLVGGFGSIYNVILKEIYYTNKEYNFKNKRLLHIQKQNINKNLGSYLSGLIEGNGTISIPKDRNPSISIVFNTKDLELANYLCNITGCGKVYSTKGNYVLWKIKDIPGVYKILSLINGYMRTPKYEYYKLAVQKINNYIEKNKLNKNPIIVAIITKINIIDIKPLDTSDIGSNAWFAGMSDADGNFSINFEKKNGKLKRIKLYYRLECKQNYKLDSNKTLNNVLTNSIVSEDMLLKMNLNYLEIMSKLASYFKCSLNYRDRDIKLKNNETNKIYLSYLFMTTSLNSKSLLIDYFNEYPLLSSKRLDYENWKSLHLFICENGESVIKTNESWNVALKISKDFNSTKTTLNWSHLHNSYLE